MMTKITDLFTQGSHLFLPVVIVRIYLSGNFSFYGGITAFYTALCRSRVTVFAATLFHGSRLAVFAAQFLQRSGIVIDTNGLFYWSRAIDTDGPLDWCRFTILAYTAFFERGTCTHFAQTFVQRAAVAIDGQGLLHRSRVAILARGFVQRTAITINGLRLVHRSRVAIITTALFRRGRITIFTATF